MSTTQKQSFSKRIADKFSRAKTSTNVLPKKDAKQLTAAERWLQRLRMREIVHANFVKASGMWFSIKNRIIGTAFNCQVCGAQLRRNNPNQIVFYCSRKCRRSRHNKREN